MDDIPLDKLLIGKTIKAIYPIDDKYRRYEADGVSIDYNGGDIRIEFTDGTRIRVWNSEWGGIDLVEDGHGS